MNVKVQGLLNAAKWIQEQHGDRVLSRVLQRCSPEVRERYTSGLALEWHPMEELVEFITAAEAVIGGPEGNVSSQMGAAGARANLKGIVLETVFYFANPNYLFRRVASMWRQFNDEGQMRMLDFSDRQASFEVVGVSTPNWRFCSLLTGWSYELMRAIGGKQAWTKHTRCRARGADRCVWEIHWCGLTLDEDELRRRRQIST